LISTYPVEDALVVVGTLDDRGGGQWQRRESERQRSGALHSCGLNE
jgi:hypothetical protein